ncbi:MAG TPA: amidase family protein [Ramlibacter sp.]|uniref:amidase n=1 Tax=Ramlibacter sp. TaxID=1917967 RepID=UPI002B6ACC75|nr:amidase family protein [Ramlibacter sp.]HVZ46602.1 amidase family protein [Ramlibacter sp.]
MFSEYKDYDALGLADLLRRKRVSPAELMEAAVARAREVNPVLNALCYEKYEESLALARALPLKGTFGAVPFLLKDSIAATRFKTSMGSRFFKDVEHKQDATLVTRFGEAGLVSFARTCAPELLMSATTEAVVNGGPTRNPWSLTHSSGGSSGGASSAVAAGIVPLAHASDGGGSIRIPGSSCGLFGLKPSRGRLPAGPLTSEIRAGLGTDGFLSRSVRDTAAALAAVCAPDPVAPYAAHGPAVNYADRSSLPSHRLRIAVWTSAWEMYPVHADCVAAVETLARHCEQLGHAVEVTQPAAFDYGAYADATTRLFASHVALDIDRRAKLLGRAPGPEDLEPATRSAYEKGKTISAADYLAAVATIHAVGRAMTGFMSNVDVVLTPSLTQPPPLLQEIAQARNIADHQEANFARTAFLIPANASGQPAATVPVHWNAEGLPIGAQMIGGAGREDVLFALAFEVEELAPWQPRLSVVTHRAFESASR